MARGLTKREFDFVQAFLGPARGNASEAARQAGYQGTKDSIKVAGYKLLTKGHVQRAIVARRDIQERRAIADADEIDRTVTSFLRASKLKVRERLRAAAELNKVSGRYSMTHHVKGKLTLEDALDLVHKKTGGATK